MASSSELRELQHVAYILVLQHSFLGRLYEKLIYCYNEKDTSLVINYEVRAVLGNLKRTENRIRGRIVAIGSISEVGSKWDAKSHIP
jgi:hypothetical protein